MSRRVIGPFELGDRLGVGGMGIVYRAIYTKTGVPVAIKILSPDLSNETSLQRRFEREINILKKLQHPHIVRYYGGGKVGQQRFYAMELVEGGSLEQKLERGQRLPWEQVVEYGLQITLALEHAHEAGVIHRDLKPANLLIGKDGQLKLTDFGIARDTTATALTAAGRTVGTYAYMAPEQIRGKPPVDRKTDLYALGCVLFEMLTGETPFTSENQGELLLKHLQEEPPRVTSLVPNCPIWLEELVFRLLEKDPDERPYDALAVQVELEAVKTKVEQTAIVSGTPTVIGGVTQPTAATGAKKKKKKKKVVAPFYEQGWFLGLCLGLVVGIGVYFSLPASEASLIKRAEAIMATDDRTRWLAAEEQYLRPLLKRFPDGEHASRARELLDRIEMERAESRARNNERAGMQPKSEAERLFMEADRYEKFGDRITALERYESLISVLKDREEDRAYVQLARREANRLRESGTDAADRAKIVADSLAKADKLLGEGKALEARAIWSSIVTLYENNQELETQVQAARDRLAGK